MLWMPLTLYLVMLVTSFVVLTWHDTRNVWNAMDATLDFAVARLEQYLKPCRTNAPRAKSACWTKRRSLPPASRKQG